jgi:hypothetical protein
MKAAYRLLIVAAWLGTAGYPMAWAQGSPVAAAGGDACGSLCRFFSGQWGSPSAPEGQAQPGADEPEAVRPRRDRAERGGRREAAPVRQDQASGRMRARAAGLAAKDVEQTSSVSRNAGELLFITGPDDVHGALVDDLTAVVSPEIQLRSAPGKGLPLKDVLSIAGADLTIASNLTLAAGAASADKVVYISKLFTEELHAVAAAGIRTLGDLNGRPVYLGPRDSDGELAARTFLAARGVTVSPVGGSLQDALKGLRQRRVAAVFVLAPKPFAPLTALTAEGLHLLPLVHEPADDAFHPSLLTAADYPALLRDGERVETVALDAILIAPRWRENAPRQKDLAAFATRFFDRITSLAGIGRHAKWQETNLAVEVENAVRLKAAEQWVAARLNSGRQASAAGSAAGLMGRQ